MVQGNSHNIPQCNASTQHRNQQYAQPKKQAREPCIIGGEDSSNRFLSNQQRKTERGRRSESQQKRTKLGFV